MFKIITDIISHAGSFLHENLLPNVLVGTGITVGYTKLIHTPLMSIFTDPNLVSLIRDYISILSLGAGLSLFILNNLIKPFLKKKNKSDGPSSDKMQTESNHDPK